MSVAAVLAVSVVAALGYLAAAAARAVVLALNAGGRRDDAIADRDALAESRFTIPVSLVVPVAPAAASGPDPSETVADLLDLNYPELEVIVVAESGDPRVPTLGTVWSLSPHEFFYRQSLQTTNVVRICRSGRDARLLVIEKEPGGRADAMNCGVNLARYRYAAVVEPGTRCGRDALLQAMAAPMRDPAGVVAASSHVESVGGWTGALESARAIMDARVGGGNAAGGIGPGSRVVVWRRDVILQMHGFSARAADPEPDLMARLQSDEVAEDSEARSVVRTPVIFGMRAVAGRASVRRAAAVQALFGMRHTRRSMILRRLVATSVAGPVCECWAVCGTAVAAAGGWQRWSNLAFALAAVSFCRALASTAALLVRGSAAGAPKQNTLNGLLILAPFEFLARAPEAIVGWAGAVGWLVRPRH